MVRRSSALPVVSTAVAAWGVAVGAAGATAQVNHAEVVRNNEPWFYTDSTQDPGTGRNYNLAIYQPPGYWSQLPTDPGVAAGARTWRWVPSAVNARREARQVTGFSVVVRPTAATQAGRFPFTGYIPDWQVHAVVQRADGGFEPDLTQAPRLSVPTASALFTTGDETRLTSLFAAALPLSETEVCWSYGWQGGEHRLLDPSQGLVGTAAEEPWEVPTWGHVDSNGVVSVVDPVAQIGVYTTLWGSYFEAAPSIVVESDFAHQRLPAPQPPPYSGFNDAAGACDLATNAVAIGWNAELGSLPAFQSAQVVALLNLGALHVGTTALFGATFELDLLDPAVGEFAFYPPLGTVTNGWFDGPRLTFPALGAAALGQYIGVELAVFSPGFATLLGTTQAHWIKVVRASRARGRLRSRPSAAGSGVRLPDGRSLPPLNGVPADEPLPAIPVGRRGRASRLTAEVVGIRVDATGIAWWAFADGAALTTRLVTVDVDGIESRRFVRVDLVEPRAGGGGGDGTAVSPPLDRRASRRRDRPSVRD